MTSSLLLFRTDKMSFANQTCKLLLTTICLLRDAPRMCWVNGFTNGKATRDSDVTDFRKASGPGPSGNPGSTGKRRDHPEGFVRSGWNQRVVPFPPPHGRAG